MKNTSLLLLSIALMASCGQLQEKPKPRVYTLSVDRENLNITGEHLVRETDQDTIMAYNDTLAYNRALLTYHAHLRTARLLENKMGQIYGFKLEDSLGTNIAESLPPQVVDSLSLSFEKLSNPLNKKGPINY